MSADVKSHGHVPERPVESVALPHGSVTFLFTDIEGSTQLNRELDSEYPELLKGYHRTVTDAVTADGGFLIQTQGDGCFAAFGSAADGIRAAINCQLALVSQSWQCGRELKVRMGLHTGRAIPVDGDYTALAVHRAARVSAAAHGGQILCSAQTLALATAQMDESEELRAQDLGLFILKDFPEPEHLHQVNHPALPSYFPQLKVGSPKLDNLPIRRTAFIGRERDKAAVKKLLQSDQLVSLVGSGGAGKTRLAIEVADELASDYADGAWLVELAGLSDGHLVPHAFAEALGIQVSSDLDPLDTLTNALEGKRLLIVVDNCEHLLDACAGICERLHRSCAAVDVLATTRERIGIPAEVVWHIPSMGVPESGLTDVTELVGYDSVRLFIERATHTFPDFSLAPDNSAAVAEICRRLDGIPLAIELAAARVGSMQPRQIAELLDDRFQLLSEGNRAALPRHRTLRAALEWSFDLLAGAERDLFDCLGVFAGGWTLPAAQCICAPRVAGSVPVLLAHLEQCSLVMRRTDDPEPRYDMLETVRALARAHLDESERALGLRQDHFNWYLRLAEESDLEGEQQRKWIDALRADHENFRAALAFGCSSAGNGREALRLSSRLAPFWKIHGDLAEGYTWLERALAVSEEASPDRPAALLGAGGLAVVRGEYSDARELLERSADLFRQRGDQAGAARTGLDLAWVAWHEGNVAQAATLLESYLAIFDDAGDSKGLADAHRMLGVIAAERHDLEEATRHLEHALASYQRRGDELGCAAALASLGITAEYRGDLEAACELMEDCLVIARECGDSRRIASSMDNLGFFWQQRGDLERARSMHEESLAISRSIGDRSLIAAALTNLGSTARQQGAFADARSALSESLGIARDTADRSRDVADVLEELGALEVAQGREKKGLTLFASAESIRNAVGYPLREFFRSMYDPLIAVARSSVPNHEEVWNEGRRITVDDAISLALDEV
ncbi:MAG: tetratricopeptide repeat protein [Acidimicrobiales bacterium]